MTILIILGVYALMVTSLLVFIHLTARLNRQWDER